MADLRNAVIRERITNAFLSCIVCTREDCPDSCNEAVQCELDEVIDELRKELCN